MARERIPNEHEVTAASRIQPSTSTPHDGMMPPNPTPTLGINSPVHGPRTVRSMGPYRRYGSIGNAQPYDGCARQSIARWTEGGSP